MKKEENVRFIKLMNGEDLISFCTINTDFHQLVLCRPLVFQFETDIEEGKQTIHVREWLPPVAVKEETATIPMSQVLIVANVEDDFIKDYMNISSILYSVKDNVLPSLTPEEKKEKVVSLDKARGKKDDTYH